MSTSIVMYGIPNCDTVKKARAWLADNGVDYRFHDFKKQGVLEEQLDDWIGQVGWEKLVNRQGTTFRKLAPAVQKGLADADAAKKLMLAQPSLIKRPVMEWGAETTVGFDPDAWALLQSR